MPEGEEKINLKQLYEIFKDKNSHGLVSLQFLCALEIFFRVDKSIAKSAITELYKNFSNETLSGARDLNFQAVSDLISEVSFQRKRSTLLNKKRKEEDNESNIKIKEERDFFEWPDQFEEELLEDLFKSLEHKKIEHTVSIKNRHYDRKVRELLEIDMVVVRYGQGKVSNRDNENFVKINAGKLCSER